MVVIFQSSIAPSLFITTAGRHRRHCHTRQMCPMCTSTLVAIIKNTNTATSQYLVKLPLLLYTGDSAFMNRHLDRRPNNYGWHPLNVHMYLSGGGAVSIAISCRRYNDCYTNSTTAFQMTYINIACTDTANDANSVFFYVDCLPSLNALAPHIKSTLPSAWTDRSMDDFTDLPWCLPWLVEASLTIIPPPVCSFIQ